MACTECYSACERVMDYDSFSSSVANSDNSSKPSTTVLVNALPNCFHLSRRVRRGRSMTSHSVVTMKVGCRCLQRSALRRSIHRHGNGGGSRLNFGGGLSVVQAEPCDSTYRRCKESARRHPISAISCCRNTRGSTDSVPATSTATALSLSSPWLM